MALKYHLNPERQGEWTRCVAKTTESCPFADQSHGDRTSIAVEHGGGIVQDSEAREALITPVVVGVYAVFTKNGSAVDADDEENGSPVSARTYTDKGQLIEAKDRARYLDKAIMPKLLAAADNPEASPQDRALASLMSEETVREGHREYKQWVLPRIEFNNDDEPVVIRRSAPNLTPSPLGAAALPQVTGAKTPKPKTPKPKTPKPPVAQQVAKAQARAKAKAAREKAKAKAKRRARRRKIVRQCRRAVRMGKAYNRQMNKVVGSTTGVSGGKSKTDDFMDGFLSWFLDLFDVK